MDIRDQHTLLIDPGAKKPVIYAMKGAYLKATGFEIVGNVFLRRKDVQENPNTGFLYLPLFMPKFEEHGSQPYGIWLVKSERNGEGAQQPHWVNGAYLLENPLILRLIKEHIYVMPGFETLPLLGRLDAVVRQYPENRLSIERVGSVKLGEDITEKLRLQTRQHISDVSRIRIVKLDERQVQERFDSFPIDLADRFATLSSSDSQAYEQQCSVARRR